VERVVRLSPGAGDLCDQESGAVTFDSRYLRRALLAVRNRGLAGFLTVHTHPLPRSGSTGLLRRKKLLKLLRRVSHSC